MTISSIASTALDQAYGIGRTIEITLNFSEAVTLAGGSLTLRLDTGAVLTIAPFNQQMSATATYTVADGEVSSDLDVANIVLNNGATLTNNNGDPVTLDVLTGFGLGNTRSIVVDGIVPIMGDRNLFSAQTTSAVGADPFAVTVGDFNGDGKSDLVTADRLGDNISVLSGDGSGGFSAQTTFATGSTPYSLTVGDFNGDGKADMAVADYDSDTVSVMLGNGSGGFSNRATFATGDGPVYVIMGDLNDDNKLDLITADWIANKGTVLFGDGSGSFSAPTVLNTGDHPYSVSIGDFNGDGRPDLAFANSGSQNASVFLNTGGGSFMSHITLATGNAPQSVVVGDFN